MVIYSGYWSDWSIMSWLVNYVTMLLVNVLLKWLLDSNLSQSVSNYWKFYFIFWKVVARTLFFYNPTPPTIVFFLPTPPSWNFHSRRYQVHLASTSYVTFINIIVPLVSSNWQGLRIVPNRVLKCDVIKMKFLKLWDLSGYSERTMSKRPTCQNWAFRGKLSLRS